MLAFYSEQLNEFSSIERVKRTRRRQDASAKQCGESIQNYDTDGMLHKTFGRIGCHQKAEATMKEETASASEALSVNGFSRILDELEAGRDVHGVLSNDGHIPPSKNGGVFHRVETSMSNPPSDSGWSGLGTMVVADEYWSRGESNKETTDLYDDGLEETNSGNDTIGSFSPKVLAYKVLVTPTTKLSRYFASLGTINDHIQSGSADGAKLKKDRTRLTTTEIDAMTSSAMTRTSADEELSRTGKDVRQRGEKLLQRRRT